MELWQILVPTVSNEGKPFRTRYHRVWDAKVRKISKGLTVLQPVKGQWVDPTGQLFAERMIPVLIACSDDDIHFIADMTAAYYGQKAVMYYRVSDAVHIRHYNDREKRCR